MKPGIQHQAGRRVRDIRKRHRLAHQEELAAWRRALHAPITRRVVANWESGRSDVPALCIQLIAPSLQVKVSDILPDLTFRERGTRQLMPRPPGHTGAAPAATEAAKVHRRAGDRPLKTGFAINTRS